MPQYERKLILVIFDFLIIWISYLLTLWIFSSELITYKFSFGFASVFLIFSLLSLIIFNITGQYKGLTRYVSTLSVYKLAIRNLIITIFLFYINSLSKIGFISFKEYLLFWFFLTSLSSAIRFTLRDILIKFISYTQPKNINLKNRVAIYGAGVGGAQLAASLRITGDYEIITFIDDNSELWNRSLNSIPINSPKKLNKLITNIDKFFIAIPSLGRNKRRALIELLEKFN